MNPAIDAPSRLETPRSARQISVIETTATRGYGFTDDPVRVVTQYWSLDGTLLAENDPCAPQTTQEPE